MGRRGVAGHLRALSTLVALMALLSGCGGSAATGSSSSASSTSRSNDPAAALGIKVQPLATGTVPSLSQGTLYLDVLEITDQEHQMMTQSGMAMHPHGIGFEYTVTGVHTVPTSAGGSQGIPAGHATFIGPDIVPNIMSPNPADWYLVAIRPVAQRHAFQNATLVYETPDLPQLQSGTTYGEDLRMLTIAPGGHNQAHKHGGLEVIVVMQGSMTVHEAGAAPQTIDKGHGAYILPDTPQQIYNDGASSAKALVFLATPAGKRFQTQLTNPV